jgi:hypothetical protein
MKLSALHRILCWRALAYAAMNGIRVIFFLWTNSIRSRHVMTSSDLVRLLIDFHLFSLNPPSLFITFHISSSFSSSLQSFSPSLFAFLLPLSPFLLTIFPYPPTANSFLFLFALSLFLILHNFSLFQTGTGTERKEMF